MRDVIPLVVPSRPFRTAPAATVRLTGLAASAPASGWTVPITIPSSSGLAGLAATTPALTIPRSSAAAPVRLAGLAAAPSSPTGGLHASIPTLWRRTIPTIGRDHYSNRQDLPANASRGAPSQVYSAYFPLRHSEGGVRTRLQNAEAVPDQDAVRAILPYHPVEEASSLRHRAEAVPFRHRVASSPAEEEASRPYSFREEEADLDNIHRVGEAELAIHLRSLRRRTLV